MCSEAHPSGILAFRPSTVTTSHHLGLQRMCLALAICCSVLLSKPTTKLCFWPPKHSGCFLSGLYEMNSCCGFNLHFTYNLWV